LCPEASGPKKTILLGKFERPKVNAEVWKEIIQDPQICNHRSQYFRDKLPVGSYKNLELSTEICIGLYCQYRLQATKAFCWACFLVAVSGAITVYYAKTIELSTGFTVGAYFVGVFRLFLAFIAGG
jgi:hypothetical protein